MTFNADADLLMLVVVLILLESLSGIGNPGIAVPYCKPSGASAKYEALRDGGLSSVYVGGSDTTGVREITGGAALAMLTFKCF